MKARYRPAKGLEFEIEGGGPLEVFKQLATLCETFSVSQCGACESDNLRYVVRVVDANSFPELHCQDCGCKLAFGQSKDGKFLYPRRKAHKQHPDVKAKKVKEGDYLPHGGWSKFVADRNDSQDD